MLTQWGEGLLTNVGGDRLETVTGRIMLVLHSAPRSFSRCTWDRTA